MKLAPMTELDAVNLMLSVIGEAPVNSLEVTGLGDASMAHQILEETSREVQEKGWHFNTEDDFELPLTTDGEIKKPSNVLRIDAAKGEYLDVVERGDRIYNKTDKTFKFDQAMKFQITFMLAFDMLPQAARHFISIRAARKFQRRIVGSTTLEQFTADDEAAALVSLQDMDTDVGDYNFLTMNPDSLGILMR